MKGFFKESFIKINGANKINFIIFIEFAFLTTNIIIVNPETTSTSFIS